MTPGVSARTTVWKQLSSECGLPGQLRALGCVPSGFVLAQCGQEGSVLVLRRLPVL